MCRITVPSRSNFTHHDAPGRCISQQVSVVSSLEPEADRAQLAAVAVRLTAIEAVARLNTDHFRACAGHDASSPMPPHARTPTTEPLTPFHSKQVPPLSLVQLADALRRQGTRHVDATALAVGVALMERYCANCPDRSPTLHSMHRLLVACVQVGMKAHCDGYYRNDTFALMAGVATAEMHVLEAALLRGLDWSVLVTAADVPWLPSGTAPSTAATATPRCEDSSCALHRATPDDDEEYVASGGASCADGTPQH